MKIRCVACMQLGGQQRKAPYTHPFRHEQSTEQISKHQTYSCATAVGFAGYGMRRMSMTSMQLSQQASRWDLSLDNVQLRR